MAAVRRLAPGESGQDGDGVGVAPPRRRSWSKAELDGLYECYKIHGTKGAALQVGLSKQRVYQLLRGAGYKLAARGERTDLKRPPAPLPATVPPPPRRVPEAAPAPDRSAGAKDGVERPTLVHRGQAAPGTQIGHIELPCPKCGHLLEQTIVLRDAGAGR